MARPDSLTSTHRAAGLLAAALLALALAAPTAAAQTFDATPRPPGSSCRLLTAWSAPARVTGRLRAACGPREGEPVTVTGQLQGPDFTFYGYGTHLITDIVFDTQYALDSHTVDLDRHVGRYVTVEGTVVLEAGQVERGPALVRVESLQPLTGRARRLSQLAR